MKIEQLIKAGKKKLLEHHDKWSKCFVKIGTECISKKIFNIFFPKYKNFARNFFLDFLTFKFLIIHLRMFLNHNFLKEGSQIIIKTSFIGNLAWIWNFGEHISKYLNHKDV
jgi:hypothetical protein